VTTQTTQDTEPDSLVAIDVDKLTTEVILTTVAPEPGKAPNTTPRVMAAIALEVTDQQSLNLAGQRLHANRILQSESRRLFNWEEIKANINKTKNLILKQEHDVMDPLELENRILSQKVNSFLKAEKFKEEQRQRDIRLRREQEERSRQIEQRAEHQVLEHRVNEEMFSDHAERIERLIDQSESVSEQHILASIPEPERIVIPQEPVVMPAPIPAPPPIVLPRGMSAAPKYTGELYDPKVELAALKVFLQGIIDGKVSPQWVTIDYSAIAKYANSVKPIGFNVPGMRCVVDFTVSQRKKG